MKSYWKYIVVSLLIGGFLGSALTLVTLRFCHRDGRYERKMTHMRERLYKDLQLTPEQKSHIDAIMQTSRDKLEEIRKTTRLQIREKLTPQQQLTFDARQAKKDARRKKRFERHADK